MFRSQYKRNYSLPRRSCDEIATLKGAALYVVVRATANEREERGGDDRATTQTNTAA